MTAPAQETLLGLDFEPGCPGCGASLSSSHRCPTCGLDVSGTRTLLERAGPSDRERSTLDKVTNDPAFKARFVDARKIGEGAFGIVLSAQDQVLQKPVAIKILIDLSPEEKARFHREATILKRLDHPRIVRVLDVVTIGDAPIILMELIEGNSLSRLIESKGKLPADEAVSIIRGVLEGLAEAHAHGVIHRDIKSDNLLVQEDGSIKILDFGFAKDMTPGGPMASLTMTGTLIGTPAYMSPELCQGMPATPASDIYSTGIVLYQMLTGKPPFTGETLAEIISKQLTQPPPPLRGIAPDSLEKVILRALAKHPSQRYADASAMMADLGVDKRAEPDTRAEKSILADLRSPAGTSKIVSRPIIQRLYVYIAALLFLATYIALFRLDAFSNFSLDLIAAIEPNPPGHTKSAVVILGVDLAAMQEYGVKPEKGQDETVQPLLDRIIFVKLLERLKKLQPAAIGLDFLFQTPRNSETDAKLATAIKECGNVIITGSWVSTPGSDVATWASPLPAIQSAARAVGSANVPPDEDGAIRRLPLKSAPDTEVEPFSLAISKLVLHTDYVSWEDGICRLNNQRPFPDVEIPTDNEGQMLLRTLKGPKGEGPFTMIPAIKFLNMPEDKIPKDIFKDRVILVGTTNRLFGDFHRTPLSRFGVGEHADFAGVEILGTAIHNILDSRFIRPAPRSWIIAGLLFFVLINVFLFARFNLFIAITVISIQAMLVTAAAYRAYQAGYLMSIVDVMAPLAIAAALGHWWRSRSTAKVIIEEVVTKEPPAPAIQQVIIPQPTPLPSTNLPAETMISMSLSPYPFSSNFLSRYRIERPLGKGAMGEVFLATQLALDRKVAIKTLTTLGPDQVERFRVEGKLLSRLHHPRIITVFDAGEDSRIPYLVCEYVEGKTLREVMDQSPPAPGEAIKIILGVLDSLSFAHSNHIYHRDIKPDNVFITNSNEVKIGDFGLAKLGSQNDASLTRAGIIMGTPTYMSPEQARGKEADSRSDLYSVGIILYEMLCGRPPFQGASAYEVIMMQIGDTPPHPRELKPEINMHVGAIIMRAIEKDLSSRFQSADEFIRDLKIATAVSMNNPNVTLEAGML